jgi:SAM-dependent methyltransferase
VGTGARFYFVNNAPAAKASVHSRSLHQSAERKREQKSFNNGEKWRTQCEHSQKRDFCARKVARKETMNECNVPPWTLDVLRSPGAGEPLRLEACRLVNDTGQVVASIEQNVIRFPVAVVDDIAFHRSTGGPRFFERSATPFAMSSLDTPVYHACLDEILPDDPEAVVVDVGGGDGRNAIHCLRRGLRRVVVIDAVADALLRFRTRLAERNPQWLDHVLLIEADARSLPVNTSCAQTVFAIESLYYLNEEYEIGLRECIRILAPSGRILVSDRDYEGGLVLRLLYHGVDGMLASANSRSLWDGRASLVRTRTFTQSELEDICRLNGLDVLFVRGMSLLPLLLGYLNGRGLLSASDVERLPQINRLLLDLSKNGKLRRCNLVIAAPRNKAAKDS